MTMVGSGSWKFSRIARSGILLGCAIAFASVALAQSFNGKWAGSTRHLDNGETDRTILELKQSGDHLSGTMSTLGWQDHITGKVDGDHFQLFAPWSHNKPFVMGQLAGKNLQMTQGHHSYVLAPATASDAIPKPPYIAPPSLHDVPYNGLAKTPPMGWNSWNLFAGKIDDATVRGIADAMVSSGMRDAGYVYVNIDDTWEGVRDSQGRLQSNHKFPNMKALADYVHSKGLKIGIYSSPGPRTCAGYPASYGHEKQDAETFASWGIDYLKYDWCSAGHIYSDEQLRPVYQKMGESLQQTGRPIVYSLCEYGRGDVQTWGNRVGGNLWRTTDDIRDEWSSMIGNAHLQIATAPYAGPGHWNDPDMLEVGNGHMTNDEYRTHMGLWALLAAPLLAGNDIRNMTQATKDVLLNREVIAIDQDALGKQATRVAQDANSETWLKPLADGGVAVGIINLASQSGKLTIRASDLKLSHSAQKARDVWAHRDVSFTNGSYSAEVPSHGMLLLRVKPRP